MSDLDDDIKATSEDLTADAERLQAIEAEKATLPPDDPRLAELAVEAEAIARRMGPKATAEREMTDQRVDSAGSG
jgi:hypothetical protein